MIVQTTLLYRCRACDCIENRRAETGKKISEQTQQVVHVCDNQPPHNGVPVAQIYGIMDLIGYTEYSIPYPNKEK